MHLPAMFVFSFLSSDNDVTWWFYLKFNQDALESIEVLLDFA